MDRTAMLTRLREVLRLYPGGIDIHDLIALTEFTGPEWRTALLDNRELISWKGKDICGLKLPSGQRHKIYETVYSDASRTVQHLKIKEESVFTKQAGELGIAGQYRYSSGVVGEAFAYSVEPVTDEQMAAAGFYRTADEAIDHLWK